MQWSAGIALAVPVTGQARPCASGLSMTDAMGGHVPCPQLGTSDNLESKFRQLEGGDVEDELAQMKRGVLTGARASAPQALPEGRPIR